ARSAASPPARGAPPGCPPDERRASAECEGFQDIRPSPNPTVDIDLAPPGDGLDHLRQRVERGPRTVELPAADVRDDDSVDAVLDRERRMLARHDPLQEQRHPARGG